MLRHGSSPQSTHSNSHEVWNGNETNAGEDKEWCVRDEVRDDHERQTADEGHNGSPPCQNDLHHLPLTI